MMAAHEVARQLRLRDIGGIIVIDFIDMEKADNRTKLHTAMREAMDTDRARHNILPLSKFGLMQLTRQRVRPATQIRNDEQCPSCNGTGKIMPSIVFEDLLNNQLLYLVHEKKIAKLTLKVHPYIQAYLTCGLLSRRLKWAMKNNCRLHVKAVSSYSLLYHQWFDANGDKIVL